MSRVTVAICTYKEAHSGYLEQSIQSVIEQTYKDLKIIVYDDASPDNTEGIVYKFMEKDKRISYVKNEKNLGLFGNFNKVLDCCDTEYVVVFHDDDVMLPHMVETEVKELDIHPNAVMCGQMYCPITMDENNKSEIHPKYSYTKDVTVFEQGRLIEENLNRGGNVFCCPSVMFRTQKINEFNLRFKGEIGNAADWLLWLEANKSYEIIGISNPIMKYRNHSNTTTNRTNIFGMCDTHYQIEIWLLRNGYERYMQKIRDNFILSAFSSLNNEPYVDSFLNLKKELYSRYNWEISDQSIIVKRILAKEFIRISKKETSFSDYFKKRNLIKEKLGAKIGIIEETMLFLKYFIARSLILKLSRLFHK